MINQPLNTQIRDIINYIRYYKCLPDYDTFYNFIYSVKLFGTDDYVTYNDEIGILLEEAIANNLIVIGDNKIRRIINILEEDDLHIYLNMSIVTALNNQINYILYNLIFKVIEYIYNNYYNIIDNKYEYIMCNFDDIRYNCVVIDWDDYVRISNYLYILSDYCIKMLYIIDTIISDIKIKQFKCQLYELMIYNKVP